MKGADTLTVLLVLGAAAGVGVLVYRSHHKAAATPAASGSGATAPATGAAAPDATPAPAAPLTPPSSVTPPAAVPTAPPTPLPALPSAPAPVPGQIWAGGTPPWIFDETKPYRPPLPAPVADLVPSRPFPLPWIASGPKNSTQPVMPSPAVLEAARASLNGLLTPRSVL